jgi:hypothetical protein
LGFLVSLGNGGSKEGLLWTSFELSGFSTMVGIGKDKVEDDEKIALREF